MPPLHTILPQLRRQRKPVLAFWLVALAGLLLYVAFTLHLCLLALGYPYQLDYGEGLVLYQSQLLAHGKSIYKAIDSFPYIFSNYPPLMQAVAGPLVALLGPSFLPGRLLSMLATLGLAVVLYTLLREAGAGALSAIVAAFLFVGSPYVYHWAPLFRIDLPALFLSTMGILVLCRATLRSMANPADAVVQIPHTVAMLHSSGSTRQKSLPVARRPIYLAGLLFVLALYTKQSYIAAPLAALIFLLINNREAARHLGLSLAIFGLGPLLVLQLATGGAFVFDLFMANVNPFSLSLLGGQVGNFVLTFAAIISLAVIGLASNKPGRITSSLARLSLLDCYLLTGLATILLAGKVGAWENYFFEALFVLCLYAGLGIERLSHGHSTVVHGLVPVALLIQLGLMWHDPRIAIRVVAEDGAANRTLAPLIANQSGMIFSEDLGLLLVNGKDIPFYSFEYAQLAEVGRWPQTWETEALRSGRFSLVILEKGTRENPDRFRRFTRQVLSALDTGYGLVAEVGKYRVYAPQPLQRPMDVSFANNIALLGYRIDSAPDQRGDLTIPPPDVTMPHLDPYPARLRLTLLWQARQTITTDYQVFVHLEDSAGRRVAQSDAMPFFNLYPTSRWSDDEIVRDYHDLDLPPDLSPGRYVLRIGLYDPHSGQRLQLTGGADNLLLAALPLNLPAPGVPPSATARRAPFENGISLLAYQLPTMPIMAGSTLTVTLYWQTDAFISRDYTVFLHLSRESELPLAQDDRQPLDGTYPTSIWNPGEVIADVHVLRLPRDLSPGIYRLLLGLYYQPDGRRLTLASGDDHLSLTTVQVTAE